MKQLRLSAYLLVLAVAVMSIPVVCAAPDLDIPQVIRDVGDNRESALTATHALATSGSTSIIAMFDAMSKPGDWNDGVIRRAINGAAAIVTQKGMEKHRAEFNLALCSQLLADKPTATKDFIITQLQITGGDDTVGTLTAFLADEQLGDSARQALTAIGTPSAVGALRRSLSRVDGQNRIGIIGSLGFLKDRSAVITLIREARSGDEAVVKAAVAALGEIGDMRAESVIATAMNSDSPSARRVAADSYLRLADSLISVQSPSDTTRRKAASMYASVLRSTDSPGLRCTALEGIGRSGSPNAAELALPYVADPHFTVSAVAAGVLAGIPDQEASDAIARVLAEIGSSDPMVKIGLLMLLNERKDARTTKLISDAAKDPNAEVRVVAWELQGKLDKPSADMESTLLEVAEAQSGIARSSAQSAYLRLASAQTGDKAIGMLKNILSMNASAEVQTSAVQALWKMGVRVDPAQESGFVNQWWVCGPFPGADMKTVHSPEERVDISKPVKIGDRDVRWTYHHPIDMSGHGILDLAGIVKPSENVTGYLYAEVIVDKAQDVLLKMGSDDGIKVWLNGAVVHDNPTTRGCSTDQDVVKASLKAGVNKFLLKITQGGGDWKACLRITDTNHKPVKFRIEGD